MVVGVIRGEVPIRDVHGRLRPAPALILIFGIVGAVALLLQAILAVA